MLGSRLAKNSTARQSRSQMRSTRLIVRATQQQTKEAKEAEDMKKLSANLGLPVEEGIFGFKPFAEVWVGRLAMGGFISSVVVEFATGRGTLQQIGLVTPSLPLFATILALAGGAVTIASGRTILRATDQKMTANELVRYRQFLGIQNEEKNIAESRGQASPADKLLSREGENSQEAAVKAEESVGQNSSGIGKDELVTDKQFANEGLKYARGVEVTNGRWAMLGFLAALLVEAGTGKGILGQGVSYLKFVGLLGPASGF
jgi:hypothetical protein